MNPIQVLQGFLGKGMSPQQVAMNMVSKNNPMLSNLMTMAQKGDTKGVETFARNMFKEKGRDFDKEFNEFKNNFKNG